MATDRGPRGDGFRLFWVVQSVGWGFYGLVHFARGFFVTGSPFGVNKALFLASGFDSHPNDWYQARDGDLLFRMRQNLQPLGAFLILVGLSFPLAEIHRRIQARDAANS